MTKNISVIDENEPIHSVQEIFIQNRYNLLPVTRKGRLSGIITDGDIKRFLFGRLKFKEEYAFEYKKSIKTAKDIMNKNVITIPFDYTIEEAGEILNREKITGAPVINNKNELVGIITKTDVLRFVTKRTGASKRGIQYLFEIKQLLTCISDLERVVKSFGGNISSSIIKINHLDPNKSKYYLRIYGIDRFKLRSLNERLSGIAKLKYVVDHPEIIRNI